MSQKAFQAALVQLTALDAIPVDDNQPPIEAPVVSLAYETIHGINYVDLNAFASERFEYFKSELEMIAKLDENLAAAETFLSLMYSYRSVSRAVPQVQQNDQSNKKFEIYERTYEVLRPEVTKMKQLMVFSEQSVQLTKDVLEKVTSERKKDKGIFPSQRFLIKLAETLNMFMVIDALKNMKTSLNNDFAMYKRALSNMKKTAMSGEDETMDNQKLYMFLATHDSFSSSLKKELAAIQSEDTLVDLVNLCADLFDERVYVLPETKHVFLKAMAFGLFLIDQDNQNEKNNITKNKKIKLERFGKIFKATPVVPLFGDLSTTIVSILKKAKSIGDTKWAYEPSDENLRKSYMITSFLDETRTEYREFVAEFGVMNNELKEVRKSQQSPSASRARHVYDIMLRGCKLVSKWTAMVLEQSAWKFFNPTDPYSNPDCPAKASDYEKVVRYNYSRTECFALVEFISMIKTIKSMLSNSAAWTSEVLAQHVYTQVQSFLTNVLADIIAHATKKKKAILNALLQVRDLSTDLIDSYDGADAGPAKAAALSKKKGDKGQTIKSSNLDLSIPSRTVGTSQSQLVYIRALLDSAFNEKAPGMKGGFMKETDFTSQQAADMEKFFNESYYYPYLLSLADTLQSCGDLSELWYKEFYLELSKEIQFPIEMSLPWILTDHILESDAPEMMEYLLYPLDLYNDAANRSLHKLKARFLYDEIEAEVNLAFDQFIFKLSQNIFTHFKTRASSILLNKEYKALLEEMVAVQDQRWEAPRNRYESILQQRHFQLLGRSIDINKLIAQRMWQLLRKSLDVAISRYESNDFTGILELQSLIQQNRLTHKLMSEYMALDPFEDLLAEVDEETSLTSFNGRVVTHTVFELVNDVIPNFCFNSVTDRFVRTPVSLIDTVTRSHAPKAQPMHMFGSRPFNLAFAPIFDVHRNYIGEIHFTALCHVLGRKYISVLFGELVQNVKNTFNISTSAYIQALIRGMPQSSKLPLFVFGLKGTYEYFSLILKPILTYAYLKTEVFQSFRELGNTMLVMLTFDRILRHIDASSVVQTAPFLGLQSTAALTSDPPPAELPSLKSVMAEANEILASSGTTVKFNELGARVDQLYRPRNSDFSLLEQFLKHLDTFIEEPLRGEWRGAQPSNDVIEVDYCVEFYRVWSAVQFAYCTPSFNEKEFTPRELFGEGLQWAGCAIIHLLDQRHRFNMFDFAYHMINVGVVDKSPLGQVAGVDMSKLVDNAVMYRGINDEIFQILQRHSKPQPAKHGEFHPPSIDGSEGTPGADATYVPYAGEHGTAKRLFTEKKLVAGQPQ